MTQASSRADGSVGAKGPDELRRQIEVTRAQLGDTVEELAAKADVKARVHSAWERVPREAVVVGGAGIGVVAAGVLLWRHYH
ncbi:DUF3618 domain-containing protein [Streptomyces europaeiscabiei]|uniref:DUF3618 domain-containing protein n=1 Tax=Streptomyces europaeiscabiei TaxID=146819 RepID=A0AAJ2PND9_9ACTN|nr:MULTISPECIES: DUF3618 domain-containing protein [Streptomyces]KFG01422.1 hypothetical protein IQ62_07815 [Streptomyces scabiei]MDX2529496.1 DUF3618 domain-containing protein [Streptomyces europaeiscabiei]MDX2762787.1 DUF3618 domain-containing protein [Streptomyces europaeiscabiei]MDX2775655.1 DUF3618 domain-containing protein [Streptomyces europaeiscabiei]MDX3130525.1 DUF3618 domain-containing protein [Streptomyces europaeiscabiei]